MENDYWWVHTVHVEPYLGENAFGPVYGSSVAVTCFYDNDRRLMTRSDGQEQVSRATVYASLSKAGSFPLGSRVTSPTNQISHVVDLAIFDSGSLTLVVEHIEVALD